NRQSGSDLCISRPKSRLDWGIELPFDKNFVTYVWFDALTNYISFADYNPSLSILSSQPLTFRDKWPALQVIGKDILVPAHGIYWLIMLHAIGFPDDQMPQLLVHGWWNLGGAKMSKSAGNIIDPFVLADKYDAEAIRYYLISDIATGQDADFSEERLIDRYNADLANTLGNLLNRTLNMAHKYRDGQLKNIPLQDLADDVNSGYKTLLADYEAAWVSSLPDRAIASVIDVARFFNSFIEGREPWARARSSHAEDQFVIDEVLYDGIEALRIIA